MDLKHIRRNDQCLNCETPLNPEKDNFCPVCGQLNNTKKETAPELVRELVGDFMHLDSKVTRSLYPLLFKPGFLTKEYLAGKRARFFHPVRLFLTVTIIMFIVLGFTKKVKDDHDPSIVFSTNEGLVMGADSLDNDSLNVNTNFLWEFSDRTVHNDTLKKYIRDFGVTDPDRLMDTLGVKKTFLSRIVMSQIIKSNVQGFEKLGDYYKHKLPWIIFSLMPVFAFVMWLVYIRRNIYFSDHLVYAFHLHTATFLIYTIASLLDLLNTVAGKLYLVMPVYYFVSLRKVYNQSWGKTILKGILAGILYFFLGIIVFGFVMGVLLLMF